MSIATMFQSLLWWIAVVNKEGDDAPNNGHAFQSLLWWIAVVNLLECEARWTVCP